MGTCTAVLIGSVAFPAFKNTVCHPRAGRTHFWFFPTPECVDGDIRLNASSPIAHTISSRFGVKAGRIEVCAGGAWGTVCDDYFTDVNAGVACRQLGYTSRGEYSNIGPIIFWRKEGRWTSACPRAAQTYSGDFYLQAGEGARSLPMTARGILGSADSFPIRPIRLLALMQFPPPHFNYCVYVIIFNMSLCKREGYPSPSPRY